jgi:CDP-paratose 2-epimerase
MKIALITGSAGLVGSEAVRFLADKFDIIIGIDNDARKFYFGAESSTAWQAQLLCDTIPNYRHFGIDIRDKHELYKIFQEFNTDITLIIHAAGQPSHDWAAQAPLIDFEINATATLHLLEAARLQCPESVFIFTSTNKVYGDLPNTLPLVELDNRWEISPEHAYFNGIDESMSIDQSLHSVFGASKIAADIMVQEYGRYFGLKTGVFRGGCLTGPNHSGAQLHGFLAYLVKCCITGQPYTIFGYQGKQVRDNIHSHDLVNMFWHFYRCPRPAAVYNVGGGRFANCSILEAIGMIERITEKKLHYTYQPTARVGDHIWWISDVRKFQSHYPNWYWQYSLEETLVQLCQSLTARHNLL